MNIAFINLYRKLIDNFVKFIYRFKHGLIKHNMKEIEKMVNKKDKEW